MADRRQYACAAASLVLLLALAGCRTGGADVSAGGATSVTFGATQPPPAPALDLPAAAQGCEHAPAGPSVIQPVAYSPASPEELSPPTHAPQAMELEVDDLVASVLAANPDIQAAAAAWRAAAQRYPQEISLDDPMFGYMLGPASWGSPDVDSGYAIEVSQAAPWPGKRQLRGSIARAQANAAFHDIGEERLRIAQATRMAYYDYYLAKRQLAVLQESVGLVQDFREIAKARYESAEVEQQDVLLADIELAELQRRQLQLERQDRVARARINTLLLAVPDAPLPPPTPELDTKELPLAPDELRELALAQRPELAAQAARIDAQRDAVALACREFYPDMEFVGRYDAFWQAAEEDLRPMVGMNFNVPIYKSKRRAAVREARARVAQQQAELDSRVSEISFAVEQAYQRVEESRKTAAVYAERLLPTARHSIDAARASYVAGRLDFLRLLQSQRQLLMLREQYYEAIAQYHQRLSELDRAVGVDPLMAAN